MRTAKILLMSLALAILVSTPTRAQEEAATMNVAGEWEFESETQQGTRTSRFMFEQDGEKLTGYTEMRDQRVRLTGTVKGNAIEFTVNMTRGGNSMQLKYVGTVNGDTAEGMTESPRGSTPWRARKLS